MKKFFTRIPSFWTSLLIALALFLCTLLLPISYTITSFFNHYSSVFFFLIFALYAIVFHLRDEWSRIFGLAITALLFGLALSYMWTSGYSDNKVIGGLLPYKDAYYYYNGARLILDGFRLPEYSVQAAGKPLFPGFLATLLLITGKNLQLSLSVLVFLLGYTSYLSANKLRSFLGAFSAAFYMALIFLYAQEQIGFTHTEVLGLILGNLGFILTWQSVEKKNFSRMIFSIIILMLAVSVRAGAFFIFPMLALWAGWVFRGEKAFSIRHTLIVLLVILLAYVGVNTVYARLVVEPGNYTFSNFAYTLYGQVHGGTGWNRAIRDMGTRDPEIIMDATIQFFKEHPLSLLIGTAKAYRDFFTPGDSGIFSFYSSRRPWLDTTLWIGSLLFLLRGIVLSIKKYKSSIPMLLLAGLIGILLSIPFLPPIDGGKRFYASTMPFFFAITAMGLHFGNESMAAKETDEISVVPLASLLGVMTAIVPLASLLGVMTAIVPIFILYLSPSPEVTSISCPADQVPYALRVDPYSHISVTPSDEEWCGERTPLCLDDFFENGVEKNVDLLFQELANQVALQDELTRIFVANDLLGRFHFFISSEELLATVPPRTVITGCATELELVEMRSRPRLYIIESVNIP